MAFVDVAELFAELSTAQLKVLPAPCPRGRIVTAGGRRRFNARRTGSQTLLRSGLVSHDDRDFGACHGAQPEDVAGDQLAQMRAELARPRAERVALVCAVGHDELTGLANRRLFREGAPS